MKRAYVLSLITLLPVALTSFVWLELIHGVASRAIDGSGHFAMAQIYDQTIFPDTFGWTNAYFAGMPFPNFYPPLFFWLVSLLHRIAFARSGIQGNACCTAYLYAVSILGRRLRTFGQESKNRPLHCHRLCRALFPRSSVSAQYRLGYIEHLARRFLHTALGICAAVVLDSCLSVSRTESPEGGSGGHPSRLYSARKFF